MKPRDLNEAVDQLIQRQRMKLWPVGAKRPDWHTLPSLWEQLEHATAYSASTSGSGGFGSQPVISMDVVTLVIEIAKDSARGAGELAHEQHRNTPDNLRAIAGALANRPTDDPDAAWWTDRLAGWTIKARGALRLDPSRPAWARGTRCPNCGADTAHAKKDGETVRTPALAITWRGPDDPEEYHADSEWKVAGIECRQCNTAWFRGPDLEALVDAVFKANATRETMTDVASGA